MPKLRFTRAADRDLAEIRNYIARDNPEIAKRFVDAIVGHCGDLLSTPHMGPARPDIGPGIRMLIVRRNYAVLYRAEGDEVQVIRVIHTARDIRQVLKADE